MSKISLSVLLHYPPIRHSMKSKTARFMQRKWDKKIKKCESVKAFDASWRNSLPERISPSSEPCKSLRGSDIASQLHTHGNPKRDSLQVKIATAAHPALRPRFTCEWTGDALTSCRRYRPRATARRRRHAVSAPRPSHARQVGLTPCPGWTS